MRTLLSHRGLTALGLTALLLPLAAQAQQREVVSKQVSVGRSEAALVLEFADDGRLEITFEDGAVLLDGEIVGSFEPSDELEAAWRSLLGQAVALDDGPLAQALVDWTVPADLTGGLADVAREIDRALEEALTSLDVQVEADAPSISLSIGNDEGSFLRGLLSSAERLGLLEQAFEGVDSNVRVHAQEDVDIDADEVVEGTIVVIQGDIRIAGKVDGDVVVVDGTIELLDGSNVSGAVRLADARILRNQGTVENGIVDILENERDLEAEIRDRLRGELADELRSDLRLELRNATKFDDDGFSILAPFRPVVRGVGGVLENLISVLILGLIGAVILAFGGDKMDAVAETARRSPGRSAMVGLAGSFLLIPVWILGTVALAVSIIGIPVAIAWLPLFPLAAGLAAVMGYLAVARNTGDWLAGSKYPWTGWIRKSNPIYTMFGGLLGLMIAFIAANVISIAPFLGFLTSLLVFAGVVITFAAVQVGFGAVILTRAGRRREYYPDYDVDEAWEAAMDVDVDDAEVDAEPATGPAQTDDVGS